MATELGKAYVQIIPSARGISGTISNVLNPEANTAGASAGSLLGGKLKVGIMAGVAAGAAAMGKLLQSSIGEGSKLQQSLGGVETLFKGSADKVKGYADQAYRTSGLSANDYMENVTGFSASLLQSVGGDTEKAADIANTAMIDMSDNANKMGTNMQSIQDAYQGFAKQNYTMLDNLKLGYGGTKTEMQRLLKDAQKLTGVEYNIDNLSDVYKAIHVIQENLDITGTTAKEAATTFSGSFASMKASASNVLGKLALGQDIMPSLKELGETTRVFIADNLIPMVGNVLGGLAGVVGPKLKDGFSAIFGEDLTATVTIALEQLGDTAKKVFDTAFEFITTGKLDLSKFGIDETQLEGFSKGFENVKETVQNVGSIFANVYDTLEHIISDIGRFLQESGAISLVGSLFQGITGFIKEASEKLKEFTTFFRENPAVFYALESAVIAAATAFGVFKTAIAIQGAISKATTALSLLKAALSISSIIDGVKLAWTGLGVAFLSNPIGIVAGAIAGLVAGLTWFFTQTELGQQIWSGFVDWIGKAWQGIADFFGGIWSGISQGAETVWNVAKGVWETTVGILKGLWEGISGFFSDLWSGIQSVASTAWGLITGAISTVVQPFIDGFMNIWNGMKDGLSQMWEGVKMVVQGAWEFIKSIVLGAALIILDIVTLNFGQLGADLGLIWEGISSAISTVWEGIKTYFSGVIDAIVGFATGLFENFAAVLSGIWEGIKAVAVATWEWLKETISNLVSGLVSAAQGIFDGFVGFLSGLWQGIKDTAVGAWEGLKGTVVGIVNGLVDGAKEAWENLKRGVQETVDKVGEIFDGLMHIDLFEAGKAILDGFFKGLKAVWDKVTDFIGGIAGWIRDHKGPIEYDRKLLIPAGNAIMDGLDQGLQDQFGAVKQTVGGIAGMISDSMTSDVAIGISADNRALESALSYGAEATLEPFTIQDWMNQRQDGPDVVETHIEFKEREIMTVVTPIVTRQQENDRRMTQLLRGVK